VGSSLSKLIRSGRDRPRRRHTDHAATRSKPAWAYPPAAHLRPRVAPLAPLMGRIARRAKPTWEEAGREITPIRVALFFPPVSQAFHESEPWTRVASRHASSQVPLLMWRRASNPAPLSCPPVAHKSPVDVFTAVENRSHANSDPEWHRRVDGSPCIAAAAHDSPRLSR
jgi:hypothetical protein